MAFLNRLNYFNKRIKFTWDYSLEEAVYFDVKVFKGERFARCGTLDTQTHFKHTNAFTYVPASSAHHPSVFKGLVKGEDTRYYLRTTSSKETYKKTLEKFKQRLLHRDYNPRMIDDILKTMPFDKRCSTRLQRIWLQQTKSIQTRRPRLYPRNRLERRSEMLPWCFNRIHALVLKDKRQTRNLLGDHNGQRPCSKGNLPIMAYKQASNLNC